MTPLTPSPAPAPKESVLHDIHKDGPAADLEQLKTEVVDVEYERRYAKSLTADQRRGLAIQIEAWRKESEKAGPEKADERLKVMNLLHDLRTEIEPTNIGRTAGDIGEAAGEFAKERVIEAAISGPKIWRKITTDAQGLAAPNNVIPWQDKAITIAKYASAAVGLTWLARTVASWWKGSKLGGRVAITLGTVGAFLFGSHLIARSTDRTTGPTLATGPSPLTDTSILPPVDVLPLDDRKWDGVDLIHATTPFIVDGAKISSVEKGGIQLLSIDDKVYRLSSGTLPYVGRLPLGGLLRSMSATKNGEFIEVRNSGSATVNYRLPRAELSRLIQTLKTSAAPEDDMELETEVPDDSGGFKKVKNTIHFALEGARAM